MWPSALLDPWPAGTSTPPWGCHSSPRLFPGSASQLTWPVCCFHGHHLFLQGHVVDSGSSPSLAFCILPVTCSAAGRAERGDLEQEGLEEEAARAGGAGVGSARSVPLEWGADSGHGAFAHLAWERLMPSSSWRHIIVGVHVPGYRTPPLLLDHTG